MTVGAHSRHPAVAGTFYPADARELTRQVDSFLEQTAPTPPSSKTSPPKALIAPHAGYVYSGPVAGTVYRQLAAGSAGVTRVVLLGPAHRVPVRGLAVSSADAFITPLGPIEIDDEARSIAISFPWVQVNDRAHAGEHSLEVHLPFLQRVLTGSWKLLPLVVGEADPSQIADVLDALWGGPETLIVVSSDLSHYHDYDTASSRDRLTAEAITKGALDHIGPYDACGAYPVRGLLAAADRHDLQVELVDLRNSGDTAGPRDQVVGYGAFALR